jgi:hypothetical protein
MLTTIPLRIGVLCSGRAPGLIHLLTRASGRGLAERAAAVECVR